jgi:hypothetical protein
MPSTAIGIPHPRCPEAPAFLVAVASILGMHTYQSQRADNRSLTRSSQRRIR